MIFKRKPRQPSLSIIVIAYDMQRQALNTLRSLACDYQEEVDGGDYEVIVVENRSARTMDAAAIAALPGNFRYFLRDEPGVSPAAAINFAFSQARGRYIGLLIDGARMVTPGVIKHALMAFRMNENALVVVPGFHLGTQNQQYHLTNGYSIEKEMALLDGIGWPQNGYGLFDIGCWSPGNPRGYLQPFMECNCLLVKADLFREIGQADERFQCPGGGMLNLDIYRRLAMLPQTQLVVLGGEGSFHQLHGGVTTSESDRREQILLRQREEYLSIRTTPYRSPTVEPLVLGQFKRPSMRLLEDSAQWAQKRFQRLADDGRDPFADEKLKRAPAKASPDPVR
jgi:hypothetical protein